MREASGNNTGGFSSHTISIEDYTKGDKLKALMKNKAEEIVFTILFLIVFICFMIFPIDKTYIKPLKSLVVMLAFKCFASIGLIKPNHTDGIKAFLFKTIFPFLTLCAMANIKKKELGTLSAFAGIGIGMNMFVFIACSGVLFGIYKFGGLSKKQAFVAAFGMGCIAAGSTCYPFVQSLDDDNEPIYFPKIAVIDFANKIWSLILIYIIIIACMSRSKLCSSFSETMNSFFIPLFTAPIVIGFIVGILLLFLDNKLTNKSSKVSEHFMLSMKELAETTTMAFIGLKLQLPNLKNIPVFIPMMVRRMVSVFFVSAIQQVMGYDVKTFQTLLIFANGAISIWPYVHFCKIVEKDDARVDLDFYLQMVAYDYSLAALINLVMALPNVEHTFLSGYILSFVFAMGTIITTLLSYYFGQTCMDPMDSSNDEEKVNSTSYTKLDED